MNNKISVLIVSYNKQGLLKKALESVLNQTLKPFEILILDNAKEDNSNYNDIAEYLNSNENIKYIKQKLPFPDSYRKLFEMAQGDYIKFLPYYSCLESTALEKMAYFLDKNESVTLVSTQKIPFYELDKNKIYLNTKDTKLLSSETEILNGIDTIKKTILEFNNYIGDFSTTMFRKKDIDFPIFEYNKELLKNYPDFLTWIQLLKKGDLAFISEKLVFVSFTDYSEEYSSTIFTQKEIDYLIFGDLLKDILSFNEKFYASNTATKNMNSFETPSLVKNINSMIESIEDFEIKKTKSVSVIIVTYNSMDTIEKCVNSSIKYTDNDDEIIIIDNNSTDNTPSYLKTLDNEKIKVIISSENSGFSKGVNLGIKNSTKDVILLLNPDAELTKNSVHKMVNALYKDEKIAGVSPLSDYVISTQSIRVYLNNLLLSLRFSHEKLNELCYSIFKEKTQDAKLVIGFCMAIKKNLLEEYGYLDETLFVGCDDLELCWRLREKGYSFKICLDTFIHHEGQVSFKTTGEENINWLNSQASDALAEILISYYGYGNVPHPEEIWGMSWYAPDFDKYWGMYKELDLISVGFNKGLKAIKNLKNQGYFDLETPFFIDFHKQPFYNIFDVKELERKLYILSAYDNISSKNHFTDYSEVNNYIKDLAYNYSLIKGIAYGFKENINSTLNINTDLHTDVLVSVVLSTNNLKTFEKSLKSILKQTYKNIEIIIIGDFSESIETIIGKFDIKTTKITSTNNNLSKVIKLGVENAQGTYIKIMTEKEYLLPTAIEILVRASKYANEKTAIIFDNYSCYYSDTTELEREFVKFEEKNLIKSQIFSPYNLLTSSLLKKEIVQSIDISDILLDKVTDLHYFNTIISNYDFYYINLNPISLKLKQKFKDQQNDSEKAYKDLSVLKTLEKIDFNYIFETKKDFHEYIKVFVEKSNVLPESTTKMINYLKINNLVTDYERKGLLNSLAEFSNRDIFSLLDITSKTSDDFSLEKNNKHLINTYLAKKEDIYKLTLLDENNDIFFEYYRNNNFFANYKETTTSQGYLILEHNWIFSLIPQKWEEILNTKIDQIWVSSNFVKEIYSNNGIIEDKIKVIGTPINSELFFKKPKVDFFEVGDKFNFLCISDFTQSSGITELIEAYIDEFKTNEKVCLTIYPNCIYNHQDRKNLITHIQSKINIPQILIKDYLDLEEIDLYNSADAFVYTYKLEKDGINVAKAMLCELPVIVTSGGATDDFCNKENSYQVEAEVLEKEVTLLGSEMIGNSLIYHEPNISSIRENLRAVFLDKNPEIGKKARETIIKTHSIKAVIKNINKAISDLTNQPILRDNIDEIKIFLYNNTLNLIQNELYEQAEKSLQSLCKYEKNQDYYYLLGFSQYKQANYEEAINSLSESMEIGKLNYDVCNIMAECLEAIEATDEADSFRKKAIQLSTGRV